MATYNIEHMAISRVRKSWSARRRGSMGVFDVEFGIAAADGGEQRSFEGTVDTGATFSSIPASILRDMGIRPSDSERFELADGSIIRRDITEARVYINGRSATTIVVFEDDGVAPILGAHALEGLRLVADPVNERLAPADHLRY